MTDFHLLNDHDKDYFCPVELKCHDIHGSHPVSIHRHKLDLSQSTRSRSDKADQNNLMNNELRHPI